MESTVVKSAGAQTEKKSYHEPLLIRHEPLRNVTGQVKYGEKSLNEKAGAANEKTPGDEA